LAVSVYDLDTANVAASFACRKLLAEDKVLNTELTAAEVAMFEELDKFGFELNKSLVNTLK
jgi:hypothetical protein